MPGVATMEWPVFHRALSVRQRLLQGLGPRRLDRLELAAGLGVGEADLVGVPVDHAVGEVLELGPAVEVLQQSNLVALLLVLGPGEEALAAQGRRGCAGA